jgi:hypothetical protein
MRLVRIADEKRHPIDQFKRIIAWRTRDPGVKLVDSHLSEMLSCFSHWLSPTFDSRAISVRSLDTKGSKASVFSLRSLTGFAASFQRRCRAPSVQCRHRSDASNFQIGVSGRRRKRGFGSLGLQRCNIPVDECALMAQSGRSVLNGLSEFGRELRSSSLSASCPTETKNPAK